MSPAEYLMNITKDVTVIKILISNEFVVFSCLVKACFTLISHKLDTSRSICTFLSHLTKWISSDLDDFLDLLYGLVDLTQTSSFVCGSRPFSIVFKLDYANVIMRGRDLVSGSHGPNSDQNYGFWFLLWPI